MILKICKESILFYITRAKYLNILCAFVLFFILALCIFFVKEKKFKNNKFFNKVYLKVFLIVVIIFWIFIFISLINSSKYDSCSSRYIQNLTLNPLSSINVHKMVPISDNKIIVVGDSRMEFILNKKNELNIPNNFSFIAKSGAKIDWLENYALNKLENNLNNLDENYNYHVVVNLGVNDLNSTTSVETIAIDYFEYYKNLALKYPNIKFYALAVNPVDEKTIDSKWYGNKRNNRKIRNFNAVMNNLIEKKNLNNLSICDSYHSISFYLPDGLHYDTDTDQRIIDYIANHCVNYK